MKLSYVMEQIDCVLVGAEGVVETGGIINKVFYLCHTVMINLFCNKNDHFYRLERSTWRLAPK